MKWSAVRWVPAALILACVVLEGSHQLRDRAMAWGDPLAPAAVGPVDERSVLVLGGRASHGVRVELERTWSALLAEQSPGHRVRAVTRLRCGSTRALVLLPELLAETRAARVFLELGADDGFDEALQLSELEKRRLDGHGFRWHTFGGVAAAPVDQAAILGSWGVGATQIKFRADGTAHLGDRVALWQHAGPNLTLVHGDGTSQELQVSVEGEGLALAGFPGLGALSLTKSPGFASVLEHAEYRLRCGDVFEAGLLLDSARSRGESSPAMKALAAQVEALERRDTAAPLGRSPAAPLDAARLTHNLRRAIRACRHYGAEAILVEPPGASAELRGVLSAVAAAEKVRVLATTTLFEGEQAASLHGVDCDADGHRRWAELAAAMLERER